MAAGGQASVKRKNKAGDGVAGMRLFIFFISMLSFFAIYVLCFCTIGWTLFGILILSVCLVMTIGTYVSLA